ncbi:MAG: hypothetical protein A2921_04440 [Candidatus Magasanikbacteria bacterium RIFCSPLOWO2_01_FULL_43_20b]|uniref:HAD family hydrolase n=1 Tax=Candidatus Magasanikbacteria bacterium RIFCSPLOWO2_12_FULL_43_12 TaxID=1798692 RepID=A0A1F6MRN5_9BACT|nr:MAG: hypothetical protein A3C74_02715 [Candidatus Magasanikbacteria bacterium RIFCSPHIGHO2_02_FULL_44_13]OGH72578.1 MAG: hypothetical protein A3I93_01450 [Candidatus Magasanikbacteria bacterium RIFCSPLOWO2_02_FULL_43_22]OGH73317.1 MAG: hypothetical protein A2921_04440 [Candidatus Magasanikbacteria bacterium RIFCSPLOWO2_01_FULL_43_20b]OGH74324.1 MAG: hypothetical protein A3G00_02630 [Candidatus Magasanikbacteria bacterium RIFCSPLOWO2_12_FULL_43_12]
MIKLVVFDLDDTLYNEKEYVLSGFKAVANFLSKTTNIAPQEIYAALVESFVLHGRGKNFEYFFEKYNLPKVDCDLLVKIYREHTPDIKLFVESELVLEHLKKKFTLAILTNGWEDAQRNKVFALKLGHYFDSIFFAQEKGLEFRKPDPRCFLNILRHYKFKPEEVLMVGDDLFSDIEGADRLGFGAFHIRHQSDLLKLIHLY